MKNNPLIIFIGEQHDNMAYGSLIEQMVRYCEEGGLKIQVFSEFESQTQKIEMENSLGEPLRHRLTDDKAFHDNLSFLNKRFIKMGDLNKREIILAESLKKYQKLKLTPRQLYEQTKSKMIVDEEVHKMIESELEQGESTGKIQVGRELKEFNLENFYHNYRAQFNHEKLHGIMLRDLQKSLDSETDVVIVISGFGHTFGLNQELTEFDGCQKFVITNFLDHLPAEIREEERAKQSSAKIGIGGLLEFKIDPTTNKAKIPEAVKLAIDERSQFEVTKKRRFKEESFENKKPSTHPHNEAGKEVVGENYRAQ